MQSPFSPFVHRRQQVKNFKRRQSELPSDLIDWDAPEIPEVEKQKIIYEEYIKELNEDHVIEDLINEEVFNVAHETMVSMVVKQFEERNIFLSNQNNLLLNQHKIQEETIKEWEEQLKEQESRNRELDNQLKIQEDATKELYNKLEQQKGLEICNKELVEQNKELGFRIEELIERDKERDFRIKELEAENSCQLDTILQQKTEFNALKIKMEATNDMLSYYKKKQRKD